MLLYRKFDEIDIKFLALCFFLKSVNNYIMSDTYKLSAITDLQRASSIDDNDLFLIDDKSGNSFISKKITYKELKDKLSEDLTSDTPTPTPTDGYDTDDLIIYPLDSAYKTLSKDAVIFQPASTNVNLKTSEGEEKEYQFRELSPIYFSYRNRGYCLLKLQKGITFYVQKKYTMFGTYDKGTPVTQTIPQTTITATATSDAQETEISLNSNISNLGVKKIVCCVFSKYVRIRIYIDENKAVLVQSQNLKLTQDYTYPNEYLKASSYATVIDKVTCRITEITHSVDVDSGGSLIGSFSGNLIFTPVTFPIN